jgi:hypothetical protein
VRGSAGGPGRPGAPWQRVKDQVLPATGSISAWSV